ncbi:MAG: prolipoprotein diacylglyceryl transferase [Armatimonadota bacterium]
MKPVLFSLPGPSLLTCLLIFAVITVGVVLWLGWLQHRRAVTRDHLFTGGAVLLISAVLLAILNRLPEIRVNAYGTMLMLGFIAGTISGIYLGRRRGVPADRVLDLGLFILFGAIIGARVVYMLITPNAGPFFDPAQVLRNGLGGLSFHGGLFGGLLAGTLYMLLAKLRFWRVVDALAPSVALGYAITRIGCFLNGCCYGKPAPEGFPWAMDFPHSPDSLLHPVLHVHPTQLYAAAMGFLMFGILLWLSRGNGLGRAGRLFMAFLMLEGVERFVMEIFRQPDPSASGPLTLAQIVSILLILAGMAGWFLLPNYPAVDAPAPAAAPQKRAKVPAGKR